MDSSSSSYIMYTESDTVPKLLVPPKPTGCELGIGNGVIEGATDTGKRGVEGTWMYLSGVVYAEGRGVGRGWKS